MFLPLWEYLRDESAEKYMKYKFLSLCIICRGIFSLIVKIKTYTHENPQEIPPTNICSESTMWKALSQVLRILGSEEMRYGCLPSLFTVYMGRQMTEQLHQVRITEITAREVQRN